MKASKSNIMKKNICKILLESWITWTGYPDYLISGLSLVINAITKEAWDRKKKASEHNEQENL